MFRAHFGRRLSRLAVAGLTVLPLLGTTALITATAPSASAVISGNVLSGTASPMWQTNSEVDALAVANGVIYAGGKFTAVRPPGVAAGGTGEVARSYLAAFNASTGALVTSFNVALNARVNALAVSPDRTRLYIGGQFTTVNGTTRNRLAAVTALSSATATGAGSLVTAFNPNPSAGVQAIVPTATTVYLGGDFTSVGGRARASVASVTAATGALNTAFAPTIVAAPATPDTAPSIRVSALALTDDGSRLLTGGGFQTVNNVLTGGMASLDPIDGSLEQWNANNVGQQPINTNCGGRVTDIVTSGSKAYVTGEGDPPGCYEGTYSADISTGNLDWNASCLGASQGLALANGVLYKGSHQHDCAFLEGGAFGGYVGGVAREAFLHRYLVGQDVRDGSFVHWSPNTNASSLGGTNSVGPQVMATDGRQVVVGGDFTRVGSADQVGLTRFEPNGDNATPEVPGRNYNGDPWPNTTPYTVSRMPVTAQPTAAGTLTVEFPAVHDADTGTLTYRVYRDGSNTAIGTATQTAESFHWSRPVLRFDDTGLAPGSVHSYRVDATDGVRVSAKSTAVSGTVRTTAPAPFADSYAALNPQTWWRLGDSGTTVADSSAGAANAGSTQGTVTRGTDGAVSGGATTLDGGSGYVISNGTSTPTAAFSTSVWFKTTTRRGGVLVAQTTGGPGQAGTTDRALVMDNNGNVVFGLGRTGIRNQGPTWNDGKWHLAVGTYDGVGTANLYVDGWMQACTVPTTGSATCAAMTRPATTPGPSYLRTGYADMTNMQLVFGRNYYARKWPLSDYLNGSVDEAAVFDRALTADQVAGMFAAGVADVGAATPAQPPTASFTSSVSGLTASLDASGSTDPDGTVDSYAWDFGDGSTGTGATTSHAYTDPGTYTVTLTVTDNSGRTGTGARQVTVDRPAAPVDTTVVATGSPWAYRYSAGAPPANWNTAAFDASTWTTANASLGFPAAGVTTNIDTSGGVTANRPIAGYFTRTFQVPSAAKAVQLTLTTRADDGVVVYVNGTEVTRSNMPTGAVTFGSYATTARNTSVAVAAPVTVTVPASLLRDGANVVSAETHLNYRATRDMSFDLQAVLRATP